MDKLKEWVATPGFQKYFKNTGWLFFGRVFMLGISFFVGAYIARYLGPSNYGLLNYVVSFVGLFAFLASFGVESIVSREIIKDHSKKDEIIGTAFYIKLTGSLIAIASVFLVSIFITKDIFTLGLIWLFSLNFIPQSFNILETYFQSQVLSKKVVFAQIISNLVSTLLKIICLTQNKGIFWLTVIFIIETSVYAALLLFSFRKFGNHIRKWRFNKNIALSLLRDSWPLMLSAIAISIYMDIDQVMIKNMLGNEQAGIYAVAVKLSEVWYFIPSIICASVFPAIVNAMKTSKELFESRLKKLYFTMFWLSFGIASFMTIFSRPIVEILFGNKYLESILTLQIYVWAGIGVSLGIAIGQYIIANNLTRIGFLNTALGAVLNILLNLILIPKIGIEGGAIATVISYTAATFGIFFFKETRPHGLLVLKSIFTYK
ncbi:MAG: flippase [bacterium]